MKQKLRYGMVIEGMARMCRIASGLGYTSSTDPESKCFYTIEKYWKDDVDPNRYKVKLVPFGCYATVFGERNLYSSDLQLLISEGRFKIISKS